MEEFIMKHKRKLLLVCLVFTMTFSIVMSSVGFSDTSIVEAASKPKVKISRFSKCTGKTTKVKLKIKNESNKTIKIDKTLLVHDFEKYMCKVGDRYYDMDDMEVCVFGKDGYFSIKPGKTKTVTFVDEDGSYFMANENTYLGLNIYFKGKKKRYYYMFYLDTNEGTYD